MDDVRITHEAYDDTKNLRQIYSDVLGGVSKLANDNYLPQFPSEHPDDHDFRKDSATLTNYLQKQKDKIVGLVCQDDIELQEDVLPQIKTVIWEDFDNRGTHGDVYWRNVFDESEAGYSVVVTDSPETNGPNLGDAQKMRLKAFCETFTADQVTNWRYRVNPVSKALELALIVFSYVSDEPLGTFGTEKVQRYKAYWLDGEAVTWGRWKVAQAKKGAKTTTLEEDGGGVLTNLTQLPVAVIGNLGDRSPLEDIARKTLEHFQTYSDYKSLIHKTCVPQRVVEGGTAESVAPMSGSVTIFPGSAGTGFGKAYFIEVEGSSLATIRISLQDIQQDIELMGVSLLADESNPVDMTATQAVLDDIGESAPIKVRARMLQDAIELTFGHIAEFYGQPRVKGGSVILGTKWDVAKRAAEEAKERQGMEFEANLNKTNAEASRMVN